jgi:hypothetical protein
MDTKEFRLFVEQMDNLTAVQRTALGAALSGKGPANEAIALIEPVVTARASGSSRGGTPTTCAGISAKAATGLSTL